MTDPIADMLTRLRNANQAYHDRVSMPYSKIKANIAEVLKSEGYVSSWLVQEPEEEEPSAFPVPPPKAIATTVPPAPRGLFTDCLLVSLFVSSLVHFSRHIVLFQDAQFRAVPKNSHFF